MKRKVLYFILVCVLIVMHFIIDYKLSYFGRNMHDCYTSNSLGIRLEYISYPQKIVFWDSDYFMIFADDKRDYRVGNSILRISSIPSYGINDDEMTIEIKDVSGKSHFVKIEKQLHSKSGKNLDIKVIKYSEFFERSNYTWFDLTKTSSYFNRLMFIRKTFYLNLLLGLVCFIAWRIFRKVYKHAKEMNEI